MVGPRARRRWLASSLGTLIALFLIIASVFAWVFVRSELGKDTRVSPDPQAIGTSGQQLHEKSPGGFDPAPGHSNTRDELKSRGAEAPKKQGAEAPQQKPGTGLTAKELSDKK